MRSSLSRRGCRSLSHDAWERCPAQSVERGFHCREGLDTRATRSRLRGPGGTPDQRNRRDLRIKAPWTSLRLRCSRGTRWRSHLKLPGSRSHTVLRRHSPAMAGQLRRDQVILCCFVQYDSRLESHEYHHTDHHRRSAPRLRWRLGLLASRPAVAEQVASGSRQGAPKYPGEMGGARSGGAPPVFFPGVRRRSTAILRHRVEQNS
jgi:hypothetical protein